VIYIVSTLLAAFLGVLETSFLPHFKLFGAVPFITLSFIVALSLKNKGYFHILIAFATGFYFDFVSNGFPHTFLIVFVLTVLVTKAFLYRDTSYDIMPSYLGTLGIATLVIYLFQIQTLIQINFIGWQNYIITVAVGIFLTLLFGYAMFKLLGKYFDWLAKESEERFRG
jgi:rod shape-determining protein MreD